MKKLLLISLLFLSIVNTDSNGSAADNQTIESVKEERDLLLKLMKNRIRETATSEFKEAITSCEGMERGSKALSFFFFGLNITTSLLALFLHTKVSLSSDKIKTIYVIQAIFFCLGYSFSKNAQTYNLKSLILKNEQKRIEALLKQLESSTTGPNEMILAYNTAILNK
jgi:hypothetical protein